MAKMNLLEAQELIDIDNGIAASIYLDEFESESIFRAMDAAFEEEQREYEDAKWEHLDRANDDCIISDPYFDWTDQSYEDCLFHSLY